MLRWGSLFLLLWALVATAFAFGYAGDADKLRDLWQQEENEKYALLVKHEGWVWLIPGEFARPFPPPPAPQCQPVKPVLCKYVAELESRLKLSKCLWGTGKRLATPSQPMRGYSELCKAVGVLDASVPAPGHKSKSPLGSLQNVIANTNLRVVFAARDYDRLMELAKRNGRALYVTNDEYFELVRLLESGLNKLQAQ